jgi:broad specificity phosphatase PhoE
MQRAQQTCRIAGLASQAQVVDELREWDYGESEGRTTSQMREQYDDPEWSVWTRTLVGGEAVQHVGDRADAVIARALVGAKEGGRWHCLRMPTFCGFSLRVGLDWRLGAGASLVSEREA